MAPLGSFVRKWLQLWQDCSKAPGADEVKPEDAVQLATLVALVCLAIFTRLRAALLNLQLHGSTSPCAERLTMLLPHCYG